MYRKPLAKLGLIVSRFRPQPEERTLVHRSASGTLGSKWTCGNAAALIVCSSETSAATETMGHRTYDALRTTLSHQQNQKGRAVHKSGADHVMRAEIKISARHVLRLPSGYP